MGFFSWWGKHISIQSRERPEHLMPPVPPPVPPAVHRIEIREVPVQVPSGSPRPLAVRAHALNTAEIGDERTPLWVAAYIGGETWTNVILVLADGSLWPVDAGAIRVCNAGQCSVNGCVVKAQIDMDAKMSDRLVRKEHGWPLE